MDMDYQKIILSATVNTSSTTKIFLFSDEKNTKIGLFQIILNYCNQVPELFSVLDESKFSFEMVTKISQGFYKLSFIDAMAATNIKFLQENLKFSFSKNDKIFFCFRLENLLNENIREISKNITTILKIFNIDVKVFEGILILCDENLIQSDSEHVYIFKNLLNGTLNSIFDSKENRIGNYII
jgi:hypothetical protein